MLIIHIIVFVVSAKKIVIHDDLKDWEGTTMTTCEMDNNVQILQGQLRKSFNFENYVKEGSLEFVLSCSDYFSVQIDNIEQKLLTIETECLQCSEEKYFTQYRIEFNTDSKDFTLSITSSGMIEIKELVISVITCLDDCIVCSQFSQQCQQCAEGFTLRQGLCVCNYFYEGQCLQECPKNTVRTLESSLCHNIEEQITLNQVDDSFSANSFIFQSNKLIGPFKLDQEVKAQFTVNSSLMAIQCQLYLFNEITKYSLRIYIDDHLFTKFKLPYSGFLVGMDVISEKKCVHRDNCVIYQLQTYAIKHSVSLPMNISIQLADNNQFYNNKTLDIVNQNIQWALGNINILQVESHEEIIPDCVSLQNNICEKCLNKILYNNQCVEACPEDTIELGADWCHKIPNYIEYTKIIVSDEVRYDQSKQVFNVLNQPLIHELTETYELANHYSITISGIVRFRFSLNGYFYIRINDQDRYQISANTTLKGVPQLLLYNFEHFDRNITISIGCHHDGPGLCYMNEYAIVQHQCYPYCLVCRGNRKQDCIEFSQDFNEFNSVKKDCIDGYYMHYQQCRPCSKRCKKCDSIYRCNECMDGYSLSRGECFKSQ